MSYRVHIIIKGQIDSGKLWKSIQQYPVNLIEVDNTTWVYGEIDDQNLGALISQCSQYGSIDASIQH